MENIERYRDVAQILRIYPIVSIVKKRKEKRNKAI